MQAEEADREKHNVRNEDIEKVLNELVGSVRVLGFLLKCLILLVVFFGSVLFGEELVKCVTIMSFNNVI